MLRKIFAAMVVVTLGVSLAACGAEPTEQSAENTDETYVIKLCYENNDGDPIDNGCDRWAELVKERTDGNVEIQIYPSSQLGAKSDLIEMMLMGQNVATIADGSYLMDYVPDFGVVMGPYLFDDWEQMYLLTGSEWWKEQSAKLEAEGLKIISENWIYGDRHLLTKQPIESLDDLKGLKIRVPNNDISVKMFELLGAAPTPMALSEVYTSLSQGVVDGVENPLTTLYTNNFQEVCKELTLTGHQMTFSNFIVGKEFFDTIPEEYQQIIIEAGQEAAEYNNTLYQEETEKLEQSFKDAGVNVRELSDIDSFKEAVKALYQNYEESGIWTPGTYETIQSIING